MRLLHLRYPTGHIGTQPLRMRTVKALCVNKMSLRDLVRRKGAIVGDEAVYVGNDGADKIL